MINQEAIFTKLAQQLLTLWAHKTVLMDKNDYRNRLDMVLQVFQQKMLYKLTDDIKENKAAYWKILIAFRSKGKTMDMIIDRTAQYLIERFVVEYIEKHLQHIMEGSLRNSSVDCVQLTLFPAKQAENAITTKGVRVTAEQFLDQFNPN